MSEDPSAPARAVARRLRAKGHQALFAGGCVRDRLLGRVPRDYDVATSARPDAVRALFPRNVPVGERFGCVMVLDEEGRKVEVTTFRSDGAYSDGRRPDAVEFGDDPEGDARRRDFTANALFEDPDSGEVIDFVAGRADLDARLLRAVGDPGARFDEDRLRMLRAVRFAAVLGWRIEPATLAAIRARAAAAGTVAAERTRTEIVRMLVEGGAARGLDLLKETGLLPVLLPEVAACEGVAQPPDFHPEGDVLVHTRLAVAGLDRLPAPASTALALATLFHDVGKPPTFKVAERIRFDGHDRVGAEMAEAACRRLRCSNAETEAVTALVARHMVWRNLPQMREARLRRFVADPLFPEHLALHRLDCAASHGDLSLAEYAVSARERFDSEPPRPPRLLSGHDLVAMGLKPGPRFAKILRAVEDAWLERRLSTPEEARAFVQERFLGKARRGTKGEDE